MLKYINYWHIEGVYYKLCIPNAGRIINFYILILYQFDPAPESLVNLLILIA